MAKYSLTQVFHWEIETEDIGAVMDSFEFPVFPEHVIGEPNFVNNVNEWEEIEGGE